MISYKGKCGICLGGECFSDAAMSLADKDPRVTRKESIMKNNKYRRHLIRSLLLVSILICLCLTSCSGGKKKEPEKPKEPEHVCEFGEWDLILMPTCSEKGLSRRCCECGKIDEYENPPISHELVTVDGKATFIYCPEGAAEIIIEKFGDGYIIMR